MQITTIESQAALILGIPILIISMLIMFLWQKKKGKQIKATRYFIIFILGVYILLLIGVTLFPMRLGINMGNSYLAVNYIPFKSTIDDIATIGKGSFSVGFDIKLLMRNIGGNILLLLPIGILFPVLWDKFRNLKSTIVAGIIISIVIESIQLIQNILMLGIRVVDIDDVIFNIIGVVIGYYIFKLIYGTSLRNYIK